MGARNQSKLWAIICGSIRDEIDFAITLDHLIEKRKEGLIEEIVLSTWKGEFENREDLLNALKSLEVIVVQSDPIDGITNKNYLSYQRQSTQLFAGMRVVPEDKFILKCRTDLSLLYVKKLLHDYETSDLSISNHNEYNYFMKYKILTVFQSISVPFGFGDVAFIGHKNDLYNLVGVTPLHIVTGNQLWEDHMWFATYFIHHFETIRIFFSRVHLINYYSLICKYIEKSIGIRSLPTFLRKFYSIYFQIIDSCFVTKTCRLLNTEQNLDPFDKNSPLVHKFANTNYVICNSELLSKFLLQGNNYLEINSNLHMFPNIEGNNKTKITLQDVKSFKEWITNEFDIDHHRVVRLTSHPVKKNKYEETGITNILKKYASDSEICEFFKEVRWVISSYDNVSISRSEIFRTYSSTILNRLKQNNASYGDIPVLLRVTVSRRELNSFALVELANELSNGNLSSDMRQKIELPFIREGFERRYLFSTPYSLNRLISNYLFSKYGKSNREEYAKLFIKSLNQYYCPLLPKIELLNQVQKICYCVEQNVLFDNPVLVSFNLSIIDENELAALISYLNTMNYPNLEDLIHQSTKYRNLLSPMQ